VTHKREFRPTPSAFAFLIAFFLVACQPAEPHRPNFIFIVADTLRADYLHHAGGSRPTPNIDALALQSTRFANTYSTSSWTLPALASIFTAQIGSQHGAVHWGAPLADESESLVEALHDAGYATGGFIANVLIDEDSGFDQGFDEFDVLVELEGWGKTKLELFPNAPASSINDRALEWLGALRDSEPDRPFFAYLHYMEPHTPYRCPEEGRKACIDGARYFAARLVAGDWNFPTAERNLIRSLYGSEVVELDTALGEFFVSLAAEGLLDNTWIVLTADHGELLGEHDRFLHGESLEPEEIRVPLLFRAPSKQRSVVETPVSLIDIAPTMLALADVEAPQTFRGRSLVPALRGQTLSPRPVVAELFPRSDATPRHRLVVVSGSQEFSMTPTGAITSTGNSARNARPRPASREELVRALGELHDWIDFSDRKGAEVPEITEEMKTRLRALGYAN